jgi:beta-glucosidase
MGTSDSISAFAWGAATSPHQIEPAAGRGPDVWDLFCRLSGTPPAGRACDHIARMEQDVALFAECGWNAYRFGISWPRVLPEGVGTPNPEGLDVYDRLIDALLARGIEPWVTVHHWDMPQALFYRGGWLNRDSAKWLADYAALLAQRFSDRVTKWFTMNEPQCFIGLGLYRGFHAPGLKLDLASVLRAGHNALRAHGETVRALRANAKKTPFIGWAPSGVVAVPATMAPEDVAAAERACFDMSADNPLSKYEPNPLWCNTWWSDPVFYGRYPQDAWERFGSAVPPIESGDLETIAQPIDFNGLIIYTGSVVRATPNGKGEVIPLPSGFPASTLGWPLLPEAMYWGLEFISRRYKAPIVIAENGVATNDWVARDGTVQDSLRVDYLERYIAEMLRWRAQGGDVRGYFHWAAMDNYEWTDVYRHRFGLIYVDFQTLERTPKASALAYRRLIEANRF